MTDARIFHRSGGYSRAIFDFLFRDAIPFPARTTFLILGGVWLSSFVFVLGVLNFMPFEEFPAGQLIPTFHHVKGYAYYVSFWAPFVTFDSADDLTSTTELYEDGVRLGPAHSDVEEMGEKGHGRFIYFESSMLRGFYFSTSDNTDPNVNGRTYTARDPKAIDPYLK